jgi:hypothetical protein
VTALSLPVWTVAVVAAFAVVVGTLAFIRGGADGRSATVVGVMLVLILAMSGWWLLDHLAARDRTAERRALDARAFELATRALMPGSALACLDAIAGETVEDACEKSLFASPEATAAAVSYVAAQLSLLASGREHARSGDPGAGTANLRRAVEADRFGIVAHVLATRDGCTPNQCSAFFLLQDASRVSANLAERSFEARVQSYMAGWPSVGARPVASNPPAAPPPATVAGAARVPNNLYFPSSASIPPVNIMTAEPPGRPPHDTTGVAESAPPSTSPRKPPPGAQPARQPPLPSNAPASAAPLQLAPSPQ